MKREHLMEQLHLEEEVIAEFGEARLIRRNGRLELRGGTMTERIEALEWVSMFLPGEVIRLRY